MAELTVTSGAGATPPGAVPHEALAGALRLVLADFREMPGLKLTEVEAARFWGFDPALCHEVLSTLVDRGYLVRGRGGLVVRGY
jgi:hypothetical protein